ncbi:MAG TPA: SprT family zinc-dependent metalloprotease [Alphaproteobacteria bacterium]
MTTAKTLALRHDHPDLPWPVIFKKLRRARQLTLRLDSKKQEIVLSMPMRVGKREAIAFLESQRDWLDRQLTKAPQPFILQIGETIPLLGRDRLIRHALGNGRGVHVAMHDDELVVTGNPDRVPRALYRFIKDLAEKHITTLSVQKAALIQRPINSLTLRDTSTRWGSCTSEGDLSFCWRLILAPAEVVDYVVGHEVAHLVHMHHKPTFWQLCRELTPYTTMGKNWLKQHGETLRVVLPAKV